jgi:hypothetical protein
MSQWVYSTDVVDAIGELSFFKQSEIDNHPEASLHVWAAGALFLD